MLRRACMQRQPRRPTLVKIDFREDQLLLVSFIISIWSLVSIRLARGRGVRRAERLMRGAPELFPATRERLFGGHHRALFF